MHEKISRYSRALFVTLMRYALYSVNCWSPHPTKAFIFHHHESNFHCLLLFTRLCSKQLFLNGHKPVDNRLQYGLRAVLLHHILYDEGKKLVLLGCDQGYPVLLAVLVVLLVLGTCTLASSHF